jgi:hypothetical protein
VVDLNTYKQRQVLAPGKRVAANFAPQIEVAIEEITG